MQASCTYGSMRGALSNGRSYRDCQAATAACGERIVGGVESLSEAGAERAVVDGAANLEQQIGAPSRPAHLL